MTSLVFEDAARDEFLAAAEWYRDKNPTVADRFVFAIEQATQIIAEAPERWPLRRSVRRYLVRKFPYVLIYRFETEIITIVAVAHQKRRPGYWRDYR